MGYRMKGSPAKQGTIKGTIGHNSALKQTETFGTNSIFNKSWDNIGLKKDNKIKFDIGLKRKKFGGKHGVSVIDTKAYTSLQKPKKTKNGQNRANIGKTGENWAKMGQNEGKRVTKQQATLESFF